MILRVSRSSFGWLVGILPLVLLLSGSCEDPSKKRPITARSAPEIFLSEAHVNEYLFFRGFDAYLEKIIVHDLVTVFI